MFLIVGLGNPGDKYIHNRHNIGFMAVEAIAQKHGFNQWRQKFQAEICSGTLREQPVILMKPQTFMNLSGQAISEICRFYKIDQRQIIIIHDELDLPPGKLRQKTGGGHGGHNGLRSIIQHIGSDFHRLRLGIGHPGHKDQVHRYVLQDFPKSDNRWLDNLIESIATYANFLSMDDLSRFANKIHMQIEQNNKDNSQ